MAQNKYDELSRFVEEVGKELFPDVVSQGTFDDYMSECFIYETAFERNPEVFGDIRWINNEDGLPLWVRPGVEWIPDYELEDDDEEDD